MNDVCFYSDATPTIFNVPERLSKIVRHRQRKPPANRNYSCPSAPAAASASASSALAYDCEGVTSPLPPDVATTSEHTYALPSPTKLKRKLDTVVDGVQVQQKRLKSSQQRVRRLRNKVMSLQDIIDDLTDKNLLTQQAAENITASFTGPAAELVQRCVNRSVGGESAKAYPPELKAFALTLQFYSRRAYEYVRETFNNCLPHQKTLSAWYSCVNGKPGFNDETFAALAEKATNTGGRLLCAMMMDEMAIRKQLDFDRAADRFVGYVDMGVGGIDDMSGLPLANEALVFMVVSLTEGWKIPLAYFLIAGLNGSERANLVNICLQRLYDVGVHVVSLTFDGCNANVAMATELGASLRMPHVNPIFPHPSDSDISVCILLDACHMLKLMRNALAEKGVLLSPSGDEIKWQYIKNLQAVQSKEGLKAGNKLHERHIQWQKQKMKVKIAAQTLSSSVADALEFCDKNLKLTEFSDCSETVEFIRVIDRLFDVLNSRNPLAKGYKCPLKTENESRWRPFLLSAIDYLKGIKLQNGQLMCESVRKIGVIGFISSAISVMHIFDCLVKQQHVLKYVLCYKFSQDHLELFFSVVRSRGGSNNNPSVVQLRATWKRLLTHNRVKAIASGNCEPLDSCSLLSISSCIDQMQRTANVDFDTVAYIRRMEGQAAEPPSVVEQEHDYLPSCRSLSLFVENVVVYIAGYVVRALKSKVSCDICREALQSECMVDDVSRSDFQLLTQKNRGGLVTPTQDVITVCKIAESCIRSAISPAQKMTIGSDVSATLVNNVLMMLIGTKVFNSLADHGLSTLPMGNHQVELMRAVTKQYVFIRLYHQCKIVTRLSQGVSCRSVCSKTVLFKGQ